VVARVSWKGRAVPREEESHAILINAHYDTVSGSPGGSDDVVGVACMLETIRALTAGPSLRHPIIFLFNGAEESLMQVTSLTFSHPLYPLSMRIGCPWLHHSASLGH
jgi:Zn-dependent M28 family amino/carboxypeptidase